MHCTPAPETSPSRGLARRLFLACGLMTILAPATPVCAARIDAVKGREYRLTKQHGPWMIMVASFRPASPDGVVQEGKTPEQHAQDLVDELRSLNPGIPAYTYRMEAPEDRVKTIDRRGRDEVRKLYTTYDQICVLAGNYPSMDDKVAQATLKWIKKYRAKCLQEEGVSWLETQRRKGPLGGAFLTVNPLLSPEEVAQHQTDPLLQKINSGSRYSLFKNEGKYTLVVCTFAGKQMAMLGDSNSPEAIREFHKITHDHSDLDEASANAWELAVALRELSANIDAYVWHDRYQSVVTVGSFDSPTDPKIQRYLQVFAAQPGADETQVAGMLQGLLGSSSIYFGMAAGGTGTKFLSIDNAGKKGNERRMWLFDPEPLLMRVPKQR
ncbi:MAG: hypothetical protein KF861_15040 [Planctomycetaceae bacterium]|nr:hypothetical protein [Planctomycetaceae bacterium]